MDSPKTKKLLRLRVRCPSSVQKFEIEVQKGSNYHDLCAIVASHLTENDDDITLYKVERDGFHCLIDDCHQTNGAQTQMTVAVFDDYDELIVRFLKDKVGVFLSLENLIIEFKYNKFKVAKVRTLQDGYVGWRKVRGDGNCYYRANIFGIIEQLIDRDRYYFEHSFNNSIIVSSP